jgi:hypothetical protein
MRMERSRLLLSVANTAALRGVRGAARVAHITKRLYDNVRFVQLLGRPLSDPSDTIKS